MKEDIDVTDFLIEVILNNTALSYNDKDLRIGSDVAILEVLKVIAKEAYNDRLQVLQDEYKERTLNN